MTFTPSEVEVQFSRPVVALPDLDEDTVQTLTVNVPEDATTDEWLALYRRKANYGDVGQWAVTVGAFADGVTPITITVDTVGMTFDNYVWNLFRAGRQFFALSPVTVRHKIDSEPDS